MISIDPKTQGITNTSKLKKTSKNKNEVKFSTAYKSEETKVNDAASNVADIGGMLFLQEIDQKAEEQENLENFGKKAFRTLKNLQMDLLQGSIHPKHLDSLNEALQSSKFIIETPELKDISEQIQLRLEVEIAKLKQSAQI